MRELEDSLEATKKLLKDKDKRIRVNIIFIIKGFRIVNEWF